MKECKWYIPCKWEQLTKNRIYKFSGVQTSRLVPSGYRYCTKCHTVQHHDYDSQGGSWRTIPRNEADILLRFVNFDTNRLGADFKD